MTSEQTPSQKRWGREVVVSSEPWIIDGREVGTIFHTGFDLNTNPVSPELEKSMLESAPNEAIREIFRKSIAEARGEI